MSDNDNNEPGQVVHFKTRKSFKAPVDQQTEVDVDQQLHIMKAVLYERMADEVIDYFIDSVMAVGAIKHRLTSVEHHERNTSMLILARQALISFLESANNLNPSLKNTAKRVVRLTQIDTDEDYDLPLYDVQINDIEEPQT